MSSTLFTDFNERAKEVSKYFIFMKNLEKHNIKLSMNSRRGIPKIKEIDSELIKTLKASGFLLLYNLVEATMRNAIEAIFDELQEKGVSYDEIRPELKKIVLENLKKRDLDTVFSSITTISIDIISAGFDKDDLFSGNLDSRKIKSTATKYGFSPSTDYAKTNHGKDLLTIKTNRNDLAHGWKSFKKIGQDKSTDELLEIKNKTVKYLRQILQNIEQYLSNQEYLDSSTSDNL
jgi:hypothetical protein